MAWEVQMPARRKTSCRKLAEKGRNPLHTGESVEKENLCYQEGRQQWRRRRAPEPSLAALEEKTAPWIEIRYMKTGMWAKSHVSGDSSSEIIPVPP